MPVAAAVFTLGFLVFTVHLKVAPILPREVRGERLPAAPERAAADGRAAIRSPAVR